MDFSALSTAPVIFVILILFLTGALAGYLLGTKRESEKKEQALEEADQKKAEALAQLASQHEEKVRVLNKANGNEIEKLEQSHKDETRQLTEAQQKLVDSLKEGHLRDTEQTNLQHGNLITQLNDANLNNTRELQRNYEERVNKLNQDNMQAVETLKRDHANEIRRVQAEADTTISALKQEQSKLQDSITQLEEKIKEDRKNNTFSMSKSGDRLMSVVRSVQELANELETTSKTVTAGEYSVFSELRDNRKREKILSLGDSDENGEMADGESPADQEEVEEGTEGVEEQR
ncbi:MAG: hypothetical protein KDI74_05165 [Gammaproteobacteria bacterium]|nr:hypothetical protein [Gammaproteobacteria bacterium]